MTQSGNIRWAVCSGAGGAGPCPWLGLKPPPVPAGGNGLKVGEGRLHPFFDRGDAAGHRRGLLPRTTTRPIRMTCARTQSQRAGAAAAARAEAGRALVQGGVQRLGAGGVRAATRGCWTKQSTYGSHLRGRGETCRPTSTPRGRWASCWPISSSARTRRATRRWARACCRSSTRLRASVPYQARVAAPSRSSPELAWGVEFF